MAITGIDDIIDWTTPSHIADAKMPLLEAALLIARDEYPNLDVNDCRAVLGAHVAAVSARVRDKASLPHTLRVVNAYLFEEAGHLGNHEDYYDPRNSYLNEVLCLRAAEHLCGQLPDNRQLLRTLEPVSNRGMLIRMLRNLKVIYPARQDCERVSRRCDRILRIAPSEARELRDRGLAHLRLGHAAGARADLCTCLAACPVDADTHELRTQLVEARSRARRLN